MLIDVVRCCEAFGRVITKGWSQTHSTLVTYSSKKALVWRTLQKCRIIYFSWLRIEAFDLSCNTITGFCQANYLVQEKMFFGQKMAPNIRKVLRLKALRLVTRTWCQHFKAFFLFVTFRVHFRYIYSSLSNIWWYGKTLPKFSTLQCSLYGESIGLLS